MSSATHTPSSLPRTEDRSGREALIRDLYAIAAYYVAHPDHPLPTQIALHHSRTPLAEVERIAAENDKHIYGDMPQTDHTLAGTSVRVTFLVTAPTGEERPL